MDAFQVIESRMKRALDVPGVLAEHHYFANAYTAGPIQQNIVISLKIGPGRWHQIVANLAWFMGLDDAGLRAFFARIRDGERNDGA